MSDVNVRWVGGEAFIGIDSTGHSLVMSSKKEGVGVKPSDMLLLALGGCTGFDVVSILQKRKERLTGFEIHIQAKQDDGPPWTFREIHVTYTFRGKGLSEKAVARAIELSEEKYCSVGATLRGTVEITHNYQIVEEE